MPEYKMNYFKKQCMHNPIATITFLSSRNLYQTLMNVFPITSGYLIYKISTDVNSVGQSPEFSRHSYWNIITVIRKVNAPAPGFVGFVSVKWIGLLHEGWPYTCACVHFLLLPDMHQKGESFVLNRIGNQHSSLGVSSQCSKNWSIEGCHVVMSS